MTLQRFQAWTQLETSLANYLPIGVTHQLVIASLTFVNVRFTARLRNSTLKRFLPVVPVQMLLQCFHIRRDNRTQRTLEIRRRSLLTSGALLLVNSQILQIAKHLAAVLARNQFDLAGLLGRGQFATDGLVLEAEAASGEGFLAVVGLPAREHFVG